MQEDDYTFVTIDNEESILTDAVIVDVDDAMDLSEIVMIDDSADYTDFITLSDDIVMLSEADMSDLYAIDIDMDGGDISIMI